MATGKRLISVTVEKAGTIYASASSTSTDTRTLNVADAAGNIIGTIATGSSTGVALPGAGTYYVYSSNMGINVTKVAVSYGDSGNSTETTTKSDVTTETTTKSDATTETTTNQTPDSGYAAAGKYVIGTSASGGNFNIATKVVEAGNIKFSLRDLRETGGRIRSVEDGGYISFELEKTAKITLNVGSGKDVIIRDYSSTAVAATFAAGSETTYEIPAGSYVMESADPASNAEIASITIAYDSSVDPTPTVVKGDADNNGVVDKNDVTMIMQYVVGIIDKVTNTEAADVNADGKVSSADAYLIQKYINNGVW